MTNYMNPHFAPIRKALRKLFPDGCPDWVVALVNELPVTLSAQGVANIAAAILALAAEFNATLDDVMARLESALSLNGNISLGSGAALNPKKKKLK